jgi:hypothetical protein
MQTLSDERMAKFKAAINRCRKGDLGALFGIEISHAELVTVSALAKATGDTFTHSLTQRLLASMEDRRSSSALNISGPGSDARRHQGQLPRVMAKGNHHDTLGY